MWMDTWVGSGFPKHVSCEGLGEKMQIGSKGWNKLVIYSKTKDGAASRDGEKQSRGWERGWGILHSFSPQRVCL